MRILLEVELRQSCSRKMAAFLFFFSGFSFRFILSPSEIPWGFFHFYDLISSAEQDFNGGYVLFTTPFKGKKKDNHNLSPPVPIHLSQVRIIYIPRNV